MLCTRMMLANREITTLFERKDLMRHECGTFKEQKDRISSYQKINSRSTWTARSFRRSTLVEDMPILNVVNIVLPKDAKTLVPTINEQSRLRKPLVRKKPGVTVVMKKTDLLAGPSSLINSSRMLEVDVLHSTSDSGIADPSKTDSAEEDDVAEEDDHYDIHPDIQELWERSAKYEEEMRQQLISEDSLEVELYEKMKKHRKKKKKKKRADNAEESSFDDDSLERTSKKKKNHSKGKKSVKLSKPQSPETIQIIRVDVTSNFSIDDISEDSLNQKMADAAANMIASDFEELKKPMESPGKKPRELEVHCKRAGFWARK